LVGDRRLSYLADLAHVSILSGRPSSFSTRTVLLDSLILNDLILRESGLQTVLLPALVLLAYGTAMLAVGVRLFRVRHSAR
jgi:hypothetical protein